VSFRIRSTCFRSGTTHCRRQKEAKEALEEELAGVEEKGQALADQVDEKEQEVEELHCGLCGERGGL
jgi:cell division protein FtsB